MERSDFLARVDKRSLYQSYLGSSLKDKGKVQTIAHCSFHADKNPSLSINMETGAFNCFACGEKGSLFDFVMKMEKVDFVSSKQIVADKQGISLNSSFSNLKPKVVASYPYKETDGTLSYGVDRLEPGKDGESKSFVRWHLKDGKKIKTHPPGKPPLPYLLHEISKVNKKDLLVVPEGEKCAHLLKDLGFNVTSFHTGKWEESYTELINGWEVVAVWEDNDKSGEKYSSMVANGLYKHNKTIKTLQFPELPEKGDFEQWLEERDSKEPEALKQELLELIERTPVWVPPKENDLFDRLESANYLRSLDLKVEWDIEHFVPSESITVFYASGGSGKTWLTLKMGICLANGTPFFNYETKKKLVVLADFENSKPILSERLKKFDPTDDFRIWRIGNKDIKLPKLDSKEWEQFKSLPKETVLIFDVLRAAHSRDENSSEHMGLIMGRLKELRDHGFTIVVLHHTSKNAERAAKGSTAIVDLADHVIGLTKVRKKGTEVVDVNEDEDSDEVKTFRFGTGLNDKSRYEKHFIYVEQTADGTFELAQDPREETVERMYRLLIQEIKSRGIQHLYKTKFQNLCNEKEGIPTGKFQTLYLLGINKKWQEKAGDRGAKLVSPIEVSRFSTPIRAENLETTDKESDALSDENIAQHFDGTEFSSFTEGP